MRTPILICVMERIFYCYRIPFDPITLKYFVVKKGNSVMLKTMENEPSSLQESDIRVEWYSVENDERTKINAHGTSLYA